MPKPAVATDFDEATNVAEDFTTEIAFDLVALIQKLAQLSDFGLRKIFHLLPRVDARLFNYLSRILATDSIQNGQGV